MVYLRKCGLFTPSHWPEHPGLYTTKEAPVVQAGVRVGVTRYHAYDNDRPRMKWGLIDINRLRISLKMNVPFPSISAFILHG